MLKKENAICSHYKYLINLSLSPSISIVLGFKQFYSKEFNQIAKMLYLIHPSMIIEINILIADTKCPLVSAIN